MSIEFVHAKDCMTDSQVAQMCAGASKIGVCLFDMHG